MNETMALGFWFTAGAVVAIVLCMVLYLLARLLIDLAVQAADSVRERRAQKARAARDALQAAKKTIEETEFAAKSPNDLTTQAQIDMHKRLRVKYGMPPVAPPHSYPKMKPGITSMDNGWYRV